METVTEPKIAGQLLRTVFHGRILKGYINDLPEELKADAQKLIGHVDALEYELLQQVEPGTFDWLTKEPEDVRWDIGAVADLMQKVHVEEGQKVYEDLLALLIQCLTAILYSQSKRKSLYIPKYQAIFKLIAEEVKADTDKQPGVFLFHKNEVFIRTGTTLSNQILKP